ncbi:hypothetical protein D3C83_200060 [compost metagenome]
MPVSTRICTICPPALDLTSTTLIGSTTPVAEASITMSRRWTACVEIESALSFLPPQPATTRMTARVESLRTGDG